MGRYTFVQIKIDKNEVLTIWGICGPPNDRKKNNIFFENLTKLVSDMDAKLSKRGIKSLHIFAGDMNAKIDEKTDKKIHMKSDKPNIGLIQETRIDWILNTRNNDKLSFHNKVIEPTHQGRLLLRDHKAILANV